MACALSLLAAQVAPAAAGRTPGAFAVTPTGSASYTIPIFTPPGVNGLTPSVALVYDSNSSVGYVGRGWSLAGFSSIARCAATIAQDGQAGPIKLESTDAYCLNGNRLRLTSGTHSADGSTYQTELADFSLITAQGAAGNGPESFVVKAKSGLYYTYGATADSRVLAAGQATAHTWYLNEIRDRSGNKIAFTYKLPDATTVGTTHPVKIEWAAASLGSDSYVYSMEFAYQLNTPPSSIYGFVAGSEIRDTDLLQSIVVNANGVIKRQYNLNYDTSPTTGAKRLVTLTECTYDSGWDCLSPTVMGYQDGAAGASTANVALSVTGALTGINSRHDFNGDGLIDIAYRRDSVWYVRFASGSGYSEEIAMGISTINGLLIAGDLRGDGKHQILLASGGIWHAHEWNGSAFVAISLGLSTSDAPNAVLSDADGDGRSDLVYVASVDGYYTTYTVAVRRNTSSNGAISFDAPAVSTHSANGVISGPSNYIPAYVESAFVLTGDNNALALSRRRPDQNGDGREDIRVSADFVLCSYDPDAPEPDCSQTGSSLHQLSATDNLAYAEVGIGGANFDFNGDGCRDSINGTSVLLSGCNGATALALNVGTSIKGIVDWDADGRDDVLTLPPGSGTLQMRSSQGNDFAAPVDSGIPDVGLCSVFAIDANGDGLDEVGCARYNQSLTLYYHNGNAQPDLATSFADGFGVTATASYSALTAPVYTPGYSAEPTQRNVQLALEDNQGMQIVASSAHTDGVNGVYTVSYTYYGGTEDLRGRGFLGFEKITTRDERNNQSRIDTYERSFPKTGHLKQTELYQSNDTLIASQSFTVDSRQAAPASSNINSFFVYVSGSSGKHSSILTTQSMFEYDDYGNLILSETTITDEDANSPLHQQSWKQTQTSTFTPDTGGNWCLGLPDSITNTYSSTSAATITRTQHLSPDPQYCRIIGTTIEPDSGNRRVDTHLEHDEFGNVKKTTVQGRWDDGTLMPERISETYWGATGQFPQAQTDAMGLVNTYTYNELTGEVATHTDPSGIVQVYNDFDNFQRLQRSAHPDGTSTHYLYTLCGSLYPCENGDKFSAATGINKLVVETILRDASDSAINRQITHLDQFDRPIVIKSQLLSGQFNRTGLQYDAWGRLSQESMPCDDNACSPYWIVKAYDELGRLTEQSHPQNQGSSTATTHIAYHGLTQVVTDAEGKISTRIMDVNGRLVLSQDHDGYFQRFSYDSVGSLTTVVDSQDNELFRATYSYGIQAFQDTTIDMDLGAWSHYYNSLGELNRWTDANGQSFSQDYDAISRPTQRTEPDKLTQWHWDGDASTPFTKGRLASISSNTPTYSESYAYDNAGRQIARTINLENSLYTYDYSYDPSTGQLRTLLYPASASNQRFAVTYGYQHGHLSHAQDASTGAMFWQATAQNALGQITTDQLGSNLIRNRAFDAATGRLAALHAGPDGGVGVMNHSYAYDNVGNLTQRQDNNIGLTEDFFYDNLHRLDYSALNGATNLDVNYDLMGNITSRSDVANGADWKYDPDKKHAVTQAGDNSYSYDANGNMTSRAGAGIAWSSYNYPTLTPVPGGSATLYYNGNRELVMRRLPHPTGAMETTIYAGELLERRIMSGVDDWRHYVKVNGQTVAIVSRHSDGVEAVTYTLGDVQGSAAVFANSAGEALLTQSFDAFGQARNGSTWSETLSPAEQISASEISQRGYTGHLMLGYGGLIHMRGRVQDSITGRFLSPDPNIPDPGFTQSYNRYAYVQNNPLSYIDPSGFDEQCIQYEETIYHWRLETILNDDGSIRDTSVSDLPPIRRPVEQCYDVYDIYNDPQNNPSEFLALPDEGGGGGGPQGMETTVACRPVQDQLAQFVGAKHCFTVIHYEDANGNSAIYRQYSLAGMRTFFPQGSFDKPTFRLDRQEWLSGSGDRYSPTHHGTTDLQFSLSVIKAAEAYNSGRDYSANGFTGPNSNTATDTIIRNAGGSLPVILGAYGQAYNWPSYLPDVPIIP
jgi:RHS repeat-associated protein